MDGFGSHQRNEVVFGQRPLTLESLALLATGRARASLNQSPDFRLRIDRSAIALEQALQSGDTIYGINTGFGESCRNEVQGDAIEALPKNLFRFHGCGTGAMLSEQQSAAVVAARLASLAGGWSAVRWELLEGLCGLLNHRICPQIPSEGSVGASGDLTPLSYVAAVLCGEREVKVGGRDMPAEVALREAGLVPLQLRPKESLALMNGTSVMTALVGLALVRARRLMRWTARLTAGMSQVLQGNPAHFDARIYQAKPHPGQALVAKWIRDDLDEGTGDASSRPVGRIQDRYSIRCAPHVIGVLADAWPWMLEWTETELNGANDNPLFDPESGEALHGGNFYGGHACFVADGLKNAVANLADLLDRQLALLCSAESNQGLPENLVGRTGRDRNAHHGFKAMQISASALTAEALKLSMPASVFSRSTECHNQDKVSMGTIAARDSLRILELTEGVAAISTLALVQAMDLRVRQEKEQISSSSDRWPGFGKGVASLADGVRESITFNDADRRQDVDIQYVLNLLEDGRLPVGATDELEGLENKQESGGL